MPKTILSRYLDPEVLNQIAGRRLEPRGLVLGHVAGAHKSPRSGVAVEFAGHREYVPGDDPKHIDWRVYFTRGRYFVKQYEMETNLVCHFILDSSESMRYGRDRQQKLRYAAEMIVALGYAVVRQNDQVSLATFDETVGEVVPPSNTMAQIHRFCELLDRSPPRRKTAMADCLAVLTGRMRRREIVMIFSDFFTDLQSLEAAVQQMRYHHHEVVLLQIMHHDELHFEFDRTTKFVGLEIPEQLLAQPQRIRRGYLEALDRFNRRLANICQRNRTERVLVNTSRNKGQVLLDYLNQRSRLNRGR